MNTTMKPKSNWIFHQWRTRCLTYVESDIGDGWEDEVHNDPKEKEALKMGQTW